jgi:hypothetical protein
VPSNARIGGLLAAALFSSVARAEDAVAVPPSDHIESVQNRAWVKRNSLMLEPVGSFAFNDPFLVRGGGGLRAVYWIRSLIGVSVDVSGWAQAPSEQARIAQRELRAQLRPTGSSWSALAGAEATPIDGKLAFFSAIVPFELSLRLGLGAASSRDAIDSSPVFAMSAGLGVRWFMTSHFGLDTGLTWRSASITRYLNGTPTPSRDTLVSFDVGVPFRIGGGP